jgi:hypothetical protein
MNNDRGLVISSKLTLLYKLAVPLEALGTAGALVVGLWSRDSTVLVVAGLMALLAMLNYRRFWHLKEIYVDGDTVHARTVLRSISFPASAIADIEVRRLSYNRAYMHLKQDTAFGNRLDFMTAGTTPAARDLLLGEVLARARATPAEPEARSFQVS